MKARGAIGVWIPCAALLLLGSYRNVAGQTSVTYDQAGNLINQVAVTAAVAPAITAQPTNQLGQTGGAASFSVVASGTGPLTYQWYENNTPISGATGSTLSIGNAQTSNFTIHATGANAYYVKVTNGAGTATSNKAALYLDTDGEGIPDWWQLQYFGAIGVAPGGDADGDGVTNLQEYLDGTNPTDATSHYCTLAIENGKSVTVSPAGTRFVSGTVVTLTALPVGLLEFGGWTGDVVTSANPLTLTMNRNYQLTAQYSAMPLDTSVPSFTKTEEGATEVRALAVQSNGQVVVAGNFQAENGVAHYGLTRLNADGSLDTSYSPSVTLGTQGSGAVVFKIPGAVNTIAVQADNKVLIAGDFNYVNDAQYSPYIVRLNTDGSPDYTFYAPLPAYTTIVQMITRATDGVILVSTASGLLELNADGSVNTAFSAALPQNASVQHMAWQTDGKVVFSGFDGNDGYLFERLNANGSVDTSYSPAVIPTPYDVIGLRSDNELYIASSGNLGTDPNNPICAVRLTATGSLDAAFNAQTTVQLNNPESLVVLPDGGFVVSGGVSYVQSDGTDVQEGLARFGSNGTLSAGLFSSLDPDGDGYEYLLVDSTGALLIGGSFTMLGTASELNLGRVSLTNGSVDTAYYAPFSSLSSVSGIAPSPDGRAIVWGEFNVVNGYYRPYLARMGAPGYLDLSFNAGTGPDAPVRSAVLQPNGAVVVGGEFSSVNGQPSTGKVARFSSGGTLDTSFAVPGVGFDNTVEVVALQNDGEIVIGGDFLNVNGVSHGHIVRLNPNGSVDASFGATADGAVYSIVPQPDGKLLVGGAFTHVDGAAAGGLARLNADGSLDASFSAASLQYLLSGYIQTIALQPNGQILAGGNYLTNVVNSVVPGAGVIRLNADGTPDTLFNARFAGLLNLSQGVEIEDLAVQPDGRIVVAGNFNVMGSSTLAGVMRINADGTLDPSCFAFGGPDQKVNSVALLANGGMMLGGEFATIGGQYRLAYTRLVSTNNITPGVLGVTVNSSSVTFSVTPQSVGSAIVSVAIQQSTDGAASFQWVGNATASGSGSWSYTGPALPPGIVYYRAVATDGYQEQATTNAAGPFAGPFDITSPLAEVGYEGIPFSYVATASALPTRFGAAGLPAWAKTSFNSSTGTLTISGTPSAEGTTAVTLTAGNAMTVTSATLQLTIYSRFSAWQAANFTSAQLLNPAVSGPLDDATGAGVANLIKYALGVPPLQAGIAGLPTAGTYSEAGQKYLTLTFTQDKLATGVTLIVEVSGDLKTWSSGAGYTTVVSNTDNGDNTETTIVRDDVSMGTGGQRFIRLRVTQTAPQ